MKKSELKTGMSVIINNKEYFVLKDYKTQEYSGEGCLVVPIENTYNWIGLDDFNEDLVFKSKPNDYVIEEIYLLNHPYNLFYKFRGDKQLIWKKDTKEGKIKALKEKIGDYKPFLKSNLKNGMIVSNSYSEYMVVKDFNGEDLLLSETGFNRLEKYDEDLKRNNFMNELHHINKVYVSVYKALSTKQKTLIWQRDPEKDKLLEELKELECSLN